MRKIIILATKPIIILIMVSKSKSSSSEITSSGAKATPGTTVAMPSSYAFGTKVQLKNTNGNLMNGGNCYIVQDRGGAIKSNRIDIFFASCI